MKKVPGKLKKLLKRGVQEAFELGKQYCEAVQWIAANPGLAAEMAAEAVKDVALKAGAMALDACTWLVGGLSHFISVSLISTTTSYIYIYHLVSTPFKI